MKLSVVIPAHNEEGSLAATIHSLVGALEGEKIPHEILVVNDHSTDGTAEVLQQLAEQYPTVRSVENERRGGFGQAVHTGIDTYTGDAFCLVMADGSDDPKDVIQYYRKLLEGYECAFGSRFMAGSKVVNYPKHKLVLNRIVNLFIRLLFGLRYNDITNAFKCYRRNVIDGIRPILSHHFNLTVELPLKAIARGFSYAVVPIRWYGRTHGVSKLRIQEMGSRYLFIILYVLLERVLSRGDYVRTDDPEPVDDDQAEVSPTRRPGWAWSAIVIAFILQMLFVYTFPLNHLGGDTSGYELVIMNRTSNLVFAPGYIFFASLPLRIDALHTIAVENMAWFRSMLQLAQHLVEIVCLAVLLFALTRVFNRLTAFLTVLFLGTCPRAMGINSSVYPEWLQADLLVLSFSFAVLAYTTPQNRLWKWVLYCASFGAFTWCVLTKFNSIVFFPGLLLFFLFEKAPWKRRAALFVAAGLFAFFNYAGFVLAVHKPATGTYALTRDRSWVLMAKLASVYGNTLPYPEGIATKRWLALSAVLPPSYEVASVAMFLNVNVVPEDIRAPMREKYGYLLTAEESVLDDVLSRNPLPPSFKVNTSSIPISYYIGLDESDELGVAVFFESIFHAPRPYFGSVLRESVAARWYALTEPTFPTPLTVSSTYPGAVAKERVVPAEPNSNWLRLVNDPSSTFLVFYGAEPALFWKPGYYFFGFLDTFAISRGKTVFLMGVGLLIALWHIFRYGWSLRTAIIVTLAFLLVVFDFFSYAVLAFRWKEWRLAYPVACILLGATFGWGVREVVAAMRRLISGSGRKVEVESPQS
ncbi:MAG TPA: glycosyltransferase family 2 protein [Thermoanaerobaculia bacterium]|nr:glycosyltransferase family 2 protein [Thermoanaerobaculia bacterium]